MTPERRRAIWRKAAKKRKDADPTGLIAARAKENRHKRVARDPEKESRGNRKRHLKYHYGLTIEDFEAMVIEQDGACKICRKPFAVGKHRHIDHCHKKEKDGVRLVRGILCGSCNRGIGMFYDDPKLLRDAAAYLDEA